MHAPAGTVRLLVLFVSLGAPVAAVADGPAERWSAGGVAAAAIQCLRLPDAGGRDGCRGAMPLQPELGLRPWKDGEFALKLGFAAGNGLESVAPFANGPWAADLQDGVRRVNGSGRSHLLTLSYGHRFHPAPGHAVRLTAGLIDGTDFLDDNAFANDEFTQFMNAALVNGPNGFVPSYDSGAAIEWDAGSLSLRGVYMRVGSGQVGRAYDYLGAQAGYTIRSSMGRGSLRLVLQGTRGEYDAAPEAGGGSRRAWIVSADQELGDSLGVWVRVGRQHEADEVLFRSLYSGGVALRGKAWRRPMDELSAGLALARGGNLDVRRSRVVEAYYRAVLTPRLAATADVQHVDEETASGGQASGWIFGLRLTLTW